LIPFTYWVSNEIGQAIAIKRANARTTILKLTGTEDKMKTVTLEMFRNTRSRPAYSFTRRAIAATLVAAFTICSTASAAGARVSPQAGMEKAPTLRERVLAIPPHAMVQVKLRSKEKIKGRLGEITNEGFIIQTATADRIDNQKISFDNVKSIKVNEEGGKKGRVAAYIIVGAGIGAAVTFLAILEALAHNG
jgi:hypothetical protein